MRGYASRHRMRAALLALLLVTFGCGASQRTEAHAVESTVESTANEIRELRFAIVPTMDRLYHRENAVSVDATGASLFLVHGVRARVTDSSVEIAQVNLPAEARTIGVACGSHWLFNDGDRLFSADSWTGTLRAVAGVRGYGSARVDSGIASIRTRIGFFTMRCGDVAAAVRVDGVHSTDVIQLVQSGEVQLALLEGGAVLGSRDSGSSWTQVVVPGGPAFRLFTDSSGYLRVAGVEGAQFVVSQNGDALQVTRSVSEESASVPELASEVTDERFERLFHALGEVPYAGGVLLSDGRTVALRPSTGVHAPNTGVAATHTPSIVVRDLDGTTHVSALEGEADEFTCKPWGSRVVIAIGSNSPDEVRPLRYFELARNGALRPLPLGLGNTQRTLSFDPHGRYVLVAGAEGETHTAFAHIDCADPTQLCLIDAIENRAVAIPRQLSRSTGHAEVVHGRVIGKSYADENDGPWTATFDAPTPLATPPQLRRALNVWLAPDGALIGVDRIDADTEGERAKVFVLHVDGEGADATVRRYATPEGTSRFVFLDAVHGAAVGHRPQQLWTTHDGGANWVPASVSADFSPLDPLEAVQATDWAFEFETEPPLCDFGACELARGLWVDGNRETTALGRFIQSRADISLPRAPTEPWQWRAQHVLDCEFTANQELFASFPASGHAPESTNTAYLTVQTTDDGGTRATWVALDVGGVFRVDTPVVTRARGLATADQLRALATECGLTRAFREGVALKCGDETRWLDASGALQTLHTSPRSWRDAVAYAVSPRGVAMWSYRNDAVAVFATHRTPARAGAGAGAGPAMTVGMVAAFSLGLGDTGAYEGAPAYYRLNFVGLASEASQNAIVISRGTPSGPAVPLSVPWNASELRACDRNEVSDGNFFFADANDLGLLLPDFGGAYAQVKLALTSQGVCVAEIEAGRAHLHPTSRTTFEGVTLNVSSGAQGGGVEIRQEHASCTLRARPQD